MSFLPPMTGNGKHTTYKMVKLGMVYYCFANIAVYYIMWLKTIINHPHFHHFHRCYKPFTVMGGKNDIVLTALPSGYLT